MEAIKMLKLKGKGRAVRCLFVYLILAQMLAGCSTPQSGMNSQIVRTVRSIVSGEMPIIGSHKEQVLALLGNPDEVTNVHVSLFGRSETWIYTYETLTGLQRFSRQIMVGTLFGTAAQREVSANSPTAAELSIDFRDGIVQSFSDDSYLNDPQI